VKILFLSGYADTAVLEAAVEKAPLLHKPFRPAELAAAVRTALDSEQTAAPETAKASKPRSKKARVIDA
jgi:DNA-binding response OmpR family regulator